MEELSMIIDPYGMIKQGDLYVNSTVVSLAILCLVG